MSKQEIFEKLTDAIIGLREKEVNTLLQEGLEAGVSPMEMITQGLNPGLTVIGEGFAKAERFMSELVISGDIMTNAMEMLRPAIEKGGEATGDPMVIGTVEGDLHDIGKAIVAAMFTGAGYRVVDIGEDQPASEFVKAAKELKACLVGASATLHAVKPYCKTINDALVEAGIRDNVIYIVGGWGMTQEWSDNMGADAFGENAFDAVQKVKMMRAGEVKKLKDRSKK
jgi:5-methyltetrahydrofolate--homocysteine methyltransferase